jgi:hypothetical protein
MSQILHKTQLSAIPFCAVRCLTQSSPTTIHTTTTSKAKVPDTTPHTLINLAGNKDIEGILLELETMYSSSQATNSDAPKSSMESEPELAALAANLFFNEKVSTSDVTSIEQCCDIFDLLDEKHPLLAQQGYSKLLELSLSKDRLQLVCCICTRLLAQDVRLEKSFYDSLVTYLTTSGQVEQALAIARTVPISKQILLSLVEPLFLFQQHMEFASLFKQYCYPFHNGGITMIDVNLVIVSMIWAKSLCPPMSETEREDFVSSIVSSLHAYKAIFHELGSSTSNPTYDRAVVNKLFFVMQDSLEHVFLSSEEDDREETAGIVADLRRKFVTSRYFSPYPFMPQDCTSTTNFPPSIRDITAQVAAVGHGADAAAESVAEPVPSVSASDSASAPFFLSNDLWAQDYADVINSLVEEREDDDGGPYYDDSDSDSEDEAESDYDSGIEEGASSSEEDSSSDEDGMEYSINLKLNSTSLNSKGHHVNNKLINTLHKRVDMESYLARGRDELPHALRESSRDRRHDAMKSFISSFQMEHKIDLLLRGSIGMFHPAEHQHQHESGEPRCPHRLAVANFMQHLGYVDEDVAEGWATEDISSQCRRQNIRLSSDLFGFEPRHHFSESSYDSLRTVKDEVPWGDWERGGG